MKGSSAGLQVRDKVPGQPAEPRKVRFSTVLLRCIFRVQRYTFPIPSQLARIGPGCSKELAVTVGRTGWARENDPRRRVLSSNREYALTHLPGAGPWRSSRAPNDRLSSAGQDGEFQARRVAHRVVDGLGGDDADESPPTRLPVFMFLSMRGKLLEVTWTRRR